MSKRIIAAFTGSSGVGKSTLLKLLQEEYFIKCIELSGRPYLPKEGDYVSNKSDSINRRINYGSLVTFTESLFEFPESDLFFSRCAIDRLAYIRSLGVGLDLEDITINEIKKIVIPQIKVFYLPIEFPLSEGEDEVRGTNEEARRNTDIAIQDILQNLNVPHIKVVGTIQERIDIIVDNLYGNINNKK